MRRCHAKFSADNLNCLKMQAIALFTNARTGLYRDYRVQNNSYLLRSEPDVSIAGAKGIGNCTPFAALRIAPAVKSSIQHRDVRLFIFRRLIISGEIDPSLGLWPTVGSWRRRPLPHRRSERRREIVVAAGARGEIAHQDVCVAGGVASTL